MAKREKVLRCDLIPNDWNSVEATITYICPASCKLSAIALRNVLSLSKTPHVACRTESRRQSPAERFQRAYNLLPRRLRISTLQFIAEFKDWSLLLLIQPTECPSTSSSSSFCASRSINSEYNCSCVPGGKSSISVLIQINELVLTFREMGSNQCLIFKK